jgi:hypothetical protein
MTRKWISAMVACAAASTFVGTAFADPNDLTGGVLIAHHAPVIVCLEADSRPEDWCGAYSAHAINSLDQVVAQLPAPGACTWYVLAAWEAEGKTWCGTEFGFGDYIPEAFSVYGFMACFPTAGLEIPTPGWPGPNEGTAFVTTGDPWNGNWVPVYWFGGYAYDYYGATIMQIDVDPPTGFCGFSNCMNPPVAFAVGPDQRGGMGIEQPGVVPTWPPVPEPWACCLPEPLGACAMLLESECLRAGGTWLGPEYTCGPVNPCPLPGACCIGGVCQVMLEENCTLVGGTFQGTLTTCEPNPCPAVCCFEAPGSVHPCQILLEDECLAIPGYWHPEWTSCEPNPCGIYTPTRTMSWGKIKGMYR